MESSNLLQILVSQPLTIVATVAAVILVIFLYLRNTAPREPLKKPTVESTKIDTKTTGTQGVDVTPTVTQPEIGANSATKLAKEAKARAISESPAPQSAAPSKSTPNGGKPNKKDTKSSTDKSPVKAPPQSPSAESPKVNGSSNGDNNKSWAEKKKQRGEEREKLRLAKEDKKEVKQSSEPLTSSRETNGTVTPRTGSQIRNSAERREAIIVLEAPDEEAVDDPDRLIDEQKHALLKESFSNNPTPHGSRPTSPSPHGVGVGVASPRHGGGVTAIVSPSARKSESEPSLVSVMLPESNPKKENDGWTTVPRKTGPKGKEALVGSAGGVGSVSASSVPNSPSGLVERFAPENDEGHIEYKLKLINITDERFEHLVSQMQFRLSEGQGKAIYRIGVSDSGELVGLAVSELEASIDCVKRMAEQLQADVHLLQRQRGRNGDTAELLVEKRVRDDGVFSEVRVAVVGNVDSGKSTLLGVLSKGVLDNGRGAARLNIFKHKHEVETGRTSDISKEILGFDSLSRPVNYSTIRPPTWPEICENSTKVVMFIDLAGHEKYLKTTVFGLTGNFPDYCMMIVGSNMGVVGMTKEHYQLTLAMKVPVFIVVSKIDICPANVLDETLQTLTKMLKAPGSNKMPMMVSTMEQASIAARNFLSDRLVPIFQVSNVTGQCLDVLRHFLFLLPPTRDWNALLQQPAEFFLDNSFTVTGVGTVVSGTLMSGLVKVNQNLLMGPDEFGHFMPIQIKGIHTNRLPVKFARAGQSASFALKKINRRAIRKGMVIVDPAAKPIASWEFDAEILIITHSTTITKNYEAVIHCGCTRQTAKIVSMEGDVLRSGLRSMVRFRYKQYPEYLKVGERLIFREGKTKGIGRVARAYPASETPAASSSSAPAPAVPKQH